MPSVLHQHDVAAMFIAEYGTDRGNGLRRPLVQRDIGHRIALCSIRRSNRCDWPATAIKEL
jgi:hypothetical protein